MGMKNGHFPRIPQELSFVCEKNPSENIFTNTSSWCLENRMEKNVEM
jgi:hypothetical protein